MGNITKEMFDMVRDYVTYIDVDDLKEEIKNDLLINEVQSNGYCDMKVTKIL